MQRSLAARLARPLGLAVPSGRPRSAPRPRRALLGAHLLAPAAAAIARLRRLLARMWRRRAGRVALLVALACVPVLAGGWLWLRHSSLVAVRQVRISGVHGPEAAAIESALTQAARGMSTLDVNTHALRAAVAPFRIVGEVHASAGFPHALHITVVEQLPVAALLAGGARTAVAADGVVLGPALLSASLPTLTAPSAPAAGQRVGASPALAGLTVLGAAPPALLARAARVYSGPRGLTVAMRNGLLVYFGDATLPHAKWLALAAVLADPSSAGASYVDVRLPSRPAAGFPGGAPPATAPAASATAGGEAGGGSKETTISSLAAGLGGGPASETSSSGGEPGERGGAGHEAEPGSQASSQGRSGEGESPGAASTHGEGGEGSSGAAEAGG